MPVLPSHLAQHLSGSHNFLETCKEVLMFGKHLIQNGLEFIGTDLRILEKETQM